MTIVCRGRLPRVGRDPPRSDLLLEVRDLRVQFPLDEGTVRAVDGVSYSLRRGRTLGVVGESGCGKTRHRAVGPADHARPGQIVGGEIMLLPAGRPAVDLAKLDPRGEQIRADSRQGDRLHLPGADGRAEPGPHDRRTR